MKIQSIWWRHVTANDLYNIEKPLPPGPKGQLHLDVPNVPALHTFFGIKHSSESDTWQSIEIQLRVFSDPSVIRQVTFRPRPKNNRYDIQRQNINSESSERHPAWTSAYGWPAIHGQMISTDVATEFLQGTPLIILIMECDDRNFYADFIGGNRDMTQINVELREIFLGKSTGVLTDISEESATSVVGLFGLELETNKVAVTKKAKTKVSSKSSGTDKPPIPRKSQGFGLAPQLRRAVEKYAVNAAIEYFSQAGWLNIQDVGDFASYDLTMVRDGMVHIVEVKGTTGLGDSIILTRNEISVHKEYFPRNALVVVSQIKILSSDPPKLEGGTVKVIQPWSLVEDWLEAMSFTYGVQNHQEVATSVD
jgi:hypothetical protein